MRIAASRLAVLSCSGSIVEMTRARISLSARRYRTVRYGNGRLVAMGSPGAGPPVRTPLPLPRTAPPSRENADTTFVFSRTPRSARTSLPTYYNIYIYPGKRTTRHCPPRIHVQVQSKVTVDRWKQRNTYGDISLWVGCECDAREEGGLRDRDRDVITW